MSYILHLSVFFEIYVIVAVSLNLLIGYGGLIQLSHAAFFGVGAYTAAQLWMNGVGFSPGLFGAGCVAGLMSLLVSLPSWRFKGDYFVICSLAVQVLLFSLFRNWVSLTGGSYGISEIRNYVTISGEKATESILFVIFAGVTLLAVGILALAKASPFGRSLQAIRDDELAARSIGISVRRIKVEAFMLASVMVGVAGAMYGAYLGYIDPTSFSLEQSFLMFSMVVVGGTGNLRGPLVGAGTLIVIPELLRLLEVPDALAGNFRLLAYGLLLIGMMHWRPQGLAGKYKFD